MSLSPSYTNAQHSDPVYSCTKTLVFIVFFLFNFLGLTTVFLVLLGTLLHARPWDILSQCAIPFAMSAMYLVSAFISASRRHDLVRVFHAGYHIALFWGYIFLLFPDDLGDYPAPFILSPGLTATLLLVAIQSPYYFLFVNMVMSVGMEERNALRISDSCSFIVNEYREMMRVSNQGSAKESHKMSFTNISTRTLNDEEKAFPEADDVEVTLSV